MLTFELALYLGSSALLALAASVTIVWRDLRRHGRIDLLNPGLGFLAYYVFYNFLVLMDPDARARAGAPNYAFVAMLGLFGVLLGTSAAHAVGRRSYEGIQSPIVPLKTLVRASLGLTLLAVGLILFMYTRTIGLAALVAGSHYERYSAAGGLLSGAFHLLPMGAGFAIAGLLRSKGLLRFGHVLVIAASLVILFYLSSSRGQILMACLLALFLVHYNIRRVPNKAVLVSAVAIWVLVAGLGIIRANINKPLASAAREVTPERIGSSFLLERTEPYQYGDRAIELVDDGPPGGTAMLGITYLYFVPHLAPRVLNLFPRPEKLDEWYARTYDPALAAIGGAWGFSPLVESYFNFGAVGCLLPFFIFSFVVNRVHLCAMRTPAGSRLRMIDCVLAAVLIQTMRASFAGFFKNYIFVLMLAGYLLVTFCIIVKRQAASPPWDSHSRSDQAQELACERS